MSRPRTLPLSPSGWSWRGVRRRTLTKHGRALKSRWQHNHPHPVVETAARGYEPGCDYSDDNGARSWRKAW